jgi:hypothetical protein
VGEVRLGIDVACRADHRAGLADEQGEFVFSAWRFRATAADPERLWTKIPAGTEVMVIMEPTRNAWVPLPAWFREKEAKVVLFPPEQSADLRAYYNNHTQDGPLDSRMLARIVATAGAGHNRQASRVKTEAGPSLRPPRIGDTARRAASRPREGLARVEQRLGER